MHVMKPVIAEMLRRPGARERFAESTREYLERPIVPREPFLSKLLEDPEFRRLLAEEAARAWT